MLSCHTDVIISLDIYQSLLEGKDLGAGSVAVQELS
jgi:hypothetical protein